MGEIAQGPDVQQDNIKADLGVTKNDTPGDAKQGTDAPDGKFSTDVSDLYADGMKGELPVFDVKPETFFRNMKTDRRRLRFDKDTTAQKYHQNTKYTRPFWIRNQEDGYTYKIK